MRGDEGRKGVFCVLLSAVIFGSMPLAARLFYERGGNAASLVFYRSFLALPPLFWLMRRERGRWPLTPRRAWALLALALFNGSTPLLLFSSYLTIPAGMATTLHFIYPVFVLVGAAVFCGEKITPVKAACVGLCTAGVALFYTPGQGAALGGMALAFASGLTYAAYVLLLDKSGLKAMPPYQMVFWLCLFSALLTALYEAPQGKLRFRFELPVWGLLFLFAFLVSVGAVALFQIGVKKVGPAQTSILSTFEPLTSILLGWAVMGEALSLRSAAGMGAVLAGVALLARKGAAPAPAGRPGR